MSSTRGRYCTVTTIETYGGSIFKSEKKYSDYDWGNKVTISPEEIASDLPVEINLGHGSTIHIRPSDILYIKNDKVTNDSNNSGEEESNE